MCGHAWCRSFFMPRLGHHAAGQEPRGAWGKARKGRQMLAGPVRATRRQPVNQHGWLPRRVVLAEVKRYHSQHMANGSANQHPNIWAPWRMDYIDSLSRPAEDKGCFICRARQGDKDVAELLLWEGKHALAMLNRYPYTGGHLLICPNEHIGQFGDLDDPTLMEMMWMVRDAQVALGRAVKAQGFNIGWNIGQCAGAGLPGHLHIHVVPRWPGDTNFMDVVGGVRMVPISLEQLYELISQAARELNLPRLSPEG